MIHSISTLSKKIKLDCPPYVKSPQYETIMGSFAYGVSSDTSDVDIYGFCIPTKDIVFPHTAGHINGFGRQIQKFEQYQSHHNIYEGKEYDFNLYNIVRYFQLCMDCNPNMIDSLYTPANCIITSSVIGDMVRADRSLFLHRGAFQKFKGYSFSQLHKCKIKNPDVGSKRKANIEKYGFDTKFAYHIIRLADECEQILTTGTIDLQRAKEHMKAVRNGEVPLEEIEKWFYDKERSLEKLYLESKVVPHSPDEDKIKNLLLHCLEEYYGNLENAIEIKNNSDSVIEDIITLLKRNKRI